MGMSAVWVNRLDIRWPKQDCFPDYKITDLNGLVRLMQL
jgi:hypothetical protein